MSLPFHNVTRTTKFNGEMVVDDIKYEYILYLIPPESSVQKREITNYFGNRMYKGDVCLGVDTNTVRSYINNRDVSAFVRVKTEDSDRVNEASGTLQIFNHCDGEEPDIWVNDVCRLGKGGEGNPVKALFVFMEQLAVQNRNKTNIKLYVGREPKNLAFLKKKYEELGFIRNADSNPEVCPKWKHDELVMEKTGLVPRPEIVDFSFLLEPEPPFLEYSANKRKRARRAGGGTKRKKYTIKRTVKHSNKTKKR